MYVYYFVKQIEKMHVGVIPDGNRRYMQKKNIFNLEEAYRLGVERFYDVVDWCYELGIDELTAYTLSLENLNGRSSEEIDILLDLFADNAVSVLDDDRVHKRRVRIKICGDRDYFIRACGKRGVEIDKNFSVLENRTKDYEGMTLNLAIAYGGRQEIINAVKKIVDSNLEINEENIRDNLWIKDYPDFIIRTSECRLSNFLMWQSAYSEIYFIDRLWEEFSRDDLVTALNEFKAREKRYGR